MMNVDEPKPSVELTDLQLKAKAVQEKKDECRYAYLSFLAIELRNMSPKAISLLKYWGDFK